MANQPESSGPKPLHAAVICAIVSTLSTMAVAYAVQNVRHYGYVLFLGVPVVSGLLTALLYHHGRRWSWLGLLGLTAGNLAVSAVLVMLCKIEGFVHDLWPQWYWEPVTRHTVTRIHSRVLTHIKSLAESAAH